MSNENGTDGKEKRSLDLAQRASDLFKLLETANIKGLPHGVSLKQASEEMAELESLLSENGTDARSGTDTGRSKYKILSDHEVGVRSLELSNYAFELFGVLYSALENPTGDSLTGRPPLFLLMDGAEKMNELNELINESQFRQA